MEAQRCIIALEVPHFHHELVYEVCINIKSSRLHHFNVLIYQQIVIMTLEALNEGVEEAMANLLKSLEQSCVVTIEMMEQGFQRVYDDLNDISIDIPLAYIILERFVGRCSNHGILSEKMMKSLPSR